MVSRRNSLDGLVVLRDTDFGQITKRRAEDLRKEISRLESLGLQTVVNNGSEEEVQEAKALLANLKGHGVGNRRGITGSEDGGQRKRNRVGATADP